LEFAKFLMMGSNRLHGEQACYGVLSPYELPFGGFRRLVESGKIREGGFDQPAGAGVAAWDAVRPVPTLFRQPRRRARQPISVGARSRFVASAEAHGESIDHGQAEDIRSSARAELDAAT
jgi:hypothetical protein